MPIATIGINTSLKAFYSDEKQEWLVLLKALDNLDGLLD